MLKSEVDFFVNSWLIGDILVFRSWNYYSLDIISIDRKSEELFECVPDHSTSNMGVFTKDEISRLISIGIFIHEPHERWNQDMHVLRANNCTCGASRTSSPTCHAFHCRKYIKP